MIILYTDTAYDWFHNQKNVLSQIQIWVIKIKDQPIARLKPIIALFCLLVYITGLQIILFNSSSSLFVM